MGGFRLGQIDRIAVAASLGNPHTQLLHQACEVGAVAALQRARALERHVAHLENAARTGAHDADAVGQIG